MVQSYGSKGRLVVHSRPSHHRHFLPPSKSMPKVPQERGLPVRPGLRSLGEVGSTSASPSVRLCTPYIANTTASGQKKEPAQPHFQATHIKTEPSHARNTQRGVVRTLRCAARASSDFQASHQDRASASPSIRPPANLQFPVLTRCAHPSGSLQSSVSLRSAQFSVCNVSAQTLPHSHQARPM